NICSLLLPFVAASLSAQSVAGSPRPPARPHPFQATDYYRLVSVADPRFAPDGRRLALTVTTVVEANDRRHSELWMVPTGGLIPAFRYTSPAAEASQPVWPQGGALGAYTSTREG